VIERYFYPISCECEYLVGGQPEEGSRRRLAIFEANTYLPAKKTLDEFDQTKDIQIRVFENHRGDGWIGTYSIPSIPTSPDFSIEELFVHFELNRKGLFSLRAEADELIQTYSALDMITTRRTSPIPTSCINLSLPDAKINELKAVEKEMSERDLLVDRTAETKDLFEKRVYVLPIGLRPMFVTATSRWLFLVGN